MNTRAAPAVFPMPFHRSLDVVDAEESRIEKRRRGYAVRYLRNSVKRGQG